MTSKKQKEVIEMMIDIYRSEPCLWQIKSKYYHDRARKDAAYSKLLERLRELEPDALKDSVVKKIHNLRSNFRKEKKKVDASKKSGAGTDEVYKPTLWYYDLFHFLSDQDDPGTSQSNLDEEEIDGVDEGNNLEFQESQSPSQTEPELDEASSTTTNKKPHPPSRPSSNKRMITDSLANDVLVSVRDHFKKPAISEDRYDLFGRSVAMRLRSMEQRQSLLAEKQLNDVLFEFELGFMPGNVGRVNYQAVSAYTASSGSASPEYTDSTSAHNQ